MANSHRRLGLNLVELLICVAIVAILAALLLPTISTGHPRGFGMGCMNHQRQIVQAGFLYQSDRKKFPNLDSAPGNDGPLALSFLTNYLSNQTNLFMCPFVIHQRERDRAWYQKRFFPELNAAFFCSNGNDYAYYDGVPTNGFTNALIADRLAWTNRSASNLWAGGHYYGRINVGFVDGHVENLKADSVVGAEYTPAWSALQDPIRR
jgi:prepilin-type N-terminal cleavage/methylation domain-containing protein/prepilin-type processing-associated H-X9-DG protein